MLFGVALALRILFWQATPDAGWPYSAYYKGDALTWVAQAQANARGVSYEFDLPLRPPGAAALLSGLWDGHSSSGRSFMVLLWCLFGASIAPLVGNTTARAVNERVGFVAGWFCAVSAGLMVLSTSLNNETPYLFLTCLAFSRWSILCERPTRWRLFGWGVVNAIACLVRVEHLLVIVLTSLGLLRAWGLRASIRRLALVGLGFGLALTPWHLEAWAAIDRFNRVEPEINAAAANSQRQVEAALSFLEWTPEARTARGQLPAFSRRTAANFVAATVAHRGGRTVDASDFEILREAFGYQPQALSRFPFVALYGALNFHLAHFDRTIGFSRAALDRRPPLADQMENYPPFLLAGLPPADLAFVYPPHVESVNEGWRLGFQALRREPAAATKQALTRIGRFWSGATYGIGGYNAPLGLSGTRHPADMVLPQRSKTGDTWRILWLFLALGGLAEGWSRGVATRRELVPWIALLTTKLVVSVAFFGYVRHGASAIPVVAILGALGIERLLSQGRTATGSQRTARSTRWGPRWLLVLCILAVGTEGVRWFERPTLALDERRVVVDDPWPGTLHETRRLSVD